MDTCFPVGLELQWGWNRDVIHQSLSTFPISEVAGRPPLQILSRSRPVGVLQRASRSPGGCGKVPQSNEGQTPDMRDLITCFSLLVNRCSERLPLIDPMLF